ncbi:MAG: dephospho-CoA kinase [Pseudomonadota bacterium]|jgi:dephospho-CoA kinase|nr:dephospho-CoA kinase [Gammaproteobacteria bacterium]MEC8085774.1 dephospho-CoA kinase [Pseudomonadota bacterium]|tara:strand:- start:250 stop:825 length:576 start_codon:yes stop_codon:yes gene_type:complete
MNIIVLSGPICAGKSTVASFFKDIGYTVINSDNLAKKIIKGDDVLQRKISKLFNDKNIFKGKAKWSKLREYVFLNKKNTIRYNKIVHPSFFKEINRILSNNKKNILLELPLIETIKQLRHKKIIISVLSKLDIRKRRLIKRGIDKKMINNIILAQKSNSFYMKKSDFVLHNNATIRQLKTRFNALRDKINE